MNKRKEPLSSWNLRKEPRDWKGNQRANLKPNMLPAIRLLKPGNAQSEFGVQVGKSKVWVLNWRFFSEDSFSEKHLEIAQFAVLSGTPSIKLNHKYFPNYLPQLLTMLFATSMLFVLSKIFSWRKPAISVKLSSLSLKDWRTGFRQKAIWANNGIHFAERATSVTNSRNLIEHQRSSKFERKWTRSQRSSKSG